MLLKEIMYVELCLSCKCHSGAIINIFPSFFSKLTLFYSVFLHIIQEGPKNNHYFLMVFDLLALEDNNSCIIKKKKKRSHGEINLGSDVLYVLFLQYRNAF